MSHSISAGVIFAVQMIISVVVLGYLSKWYVWPFLRARPVERGLQWLLLPSVAHHIGMGTLFTRIVPPHSSKLIAWAVVGGDGLVLVLAAFLANALYKGLPSVRRWAWAFTVAGFVYNGSGLALPVDSYINGLGPHYYVLTLYVPVLAMAHVLVALMLITRRAEVRQLGAGRRPAEA